MKAALRFRALPPFHLHAFEMTVFSRLRRNWQGARKPRESNPRQVLKIHRSRSSAADKTGNSPTFIGERKGTLKLDQGVVRVFKSMLATRFSSLGLPSPETKQGGSHSQRRIQINKRCLNTVQKSLQVLRREGKRHMYNPCGCWSCIPFLITPPTL